MDTPTYSSLRQEAKEYLRKYWGETLPNQDPFVEGIILDIMAGFTLEKYTQLELMVMQNAEAKKIT